MSRKETLPERAVAAVLLAAGTSSRMGAVNKLLLEVDGEPLVRRAARVAAAAGLAPVMVVLGHQAETVAATLAGLDLETVVNRDYDRGMTSSLRTGIAALPDGVSAAVMMLADMPRVTVAMLRALAEAHRTGGALLAISDYGGVNAPPTLFDRALFPEILALPDGRCPRSLVRQYRERAVIVAQPPAALADLDRPGDLSRLASVAG